MFMACRLAVFPWDAEISGTRNSRQCFPWELIHALHLLDDILLMVTWLATAGYAEARLEMEVPRPSFHGQHMVGKTVGKP